MYKYGMRSRPFGIGCQPDGHKKYVEANRKSDGYYGFVYYDRKLTEEEVYKYELHPIEKDEAEENKEFAFSEMAEAMQHPETVTLSELEDIAYNHGLEGEYVEEFLLSGGGVM